MDATLISVPSSTKNAEKKRDPEMHQTKRETSGIAGDMVNKIKGGEKIQLGFGKHRGKAIFLLKEAFDTSSLVEDTGFKPHNPIKISSTNG